MKGDYPTGKLKIGSTSNRNTLIDFIWFSHLNSAQAPSNRLRMAYHCFLSVFVVCPFERKKKRESYSCYVVGRDILMPRTVRFIATA